MRRRPVTEMVLDDIEGWLDSFQPIDDLAGQIAGYGVDAARAGVDMQHDHRNTSR
jgi:hypothetical protein